ncbi:MAG: beta-propeller fold lactonase family protein [Planctomycetes bacterium]|nr:beta-propeller fold lactonase family protein [Planctomycetota bacterium]
MSIQRTFQNALSLALGICAVSAAASQSLVPAAFVANNGNNEGAVTSFTLDSAGRPAFVQKLVIGGAGSPGTNAYSIDITPGGRFLATSHATAFTTEQITLIEIHSDATLTLLSTRTTPDSPLSLKWISDTLLAVTRTQYGGTNQVITYRLEPETGVLTEVDRGAGGTFSSVVETHPSGRFVYLGDSNSNFIRVFEASADGFLSEIQTEFTGTTYPLGVAISPDGSRLYAGGGISSGRHAILGYDVGPDGRITPMPGAPFTSSGDSPFNIDYSEYGSIVFVGHGADATVRSFLADPATGSLSETGYVFDVGLQGSFGDSATLGDFLLVTDDTSAIDGITGLYSFQILSSGEFTSTGPVVGTSATAPTGIAVWKPPTQNCPADLDHDGVISLADLAVLLSTFGTPSGATPEQGDLDADGDVELQDLASLLAVFGLPCPG